MNETWLVFAAAVSVAVFREEFHASQKFQTLSLENRFTSRS